MEFSKIAAVSNKIAPTWSLDRMVAVNPFHGFADEDMTEVANKFKTIKGANLFQELSVYQALFLKQVFDEEHIQEALKRSNPAQLNANKIVLDLVGSNEFEQPPLALTITAHCQHHYVNDLQAFKIHYLSTWLGQLTAETANLASVNLFNNFLEYARINKSATVFGLRNFNRYLAEIPLENYEQFFVEQLQLDAKDEEAYLFSLLYTLPGWASYLRGIDWDEELKGSKSRVLLDFMYVLLTWEYLMLRVHASKNVDTAWKKSLGLARGNDIEATIALKSVLQTALEISQVEQLGQSLVQTSHEEQPNEEPTSQLVFCIDVRSEVFRRNLETVAPGIETKGFAGFFGLPVTYHYLGSENPDKNCPVLLQPSIQIKEANKDTEEHKNIIAARQQKSFLQRVISQFKRTPIVSFGFVSPLGLFYLPKLISDAFHFTRPISAPAKPLEAPQVQFINFPIEQQKTWALNTIKNMGFETFSKIVCLIGHGTTTTNNPQNAGLTCGACGGHGGDKNAIAAAQVFNNAEVRAFLKASGIAIPNSTYFIAGFHNTTTDEITLYNEDDVPQRLYKELVLLKGNLQHARLLSLQERGNRMQSMKNNQQEFIQREKDWSETQPELGLAGCNYFIVANRTQTKGVDLKSSSFLHDYDWRTDTDFRVLKGILTAPMVVTSWINLQYYASTVDNANFGSGNKVIHNVVSNLGVLEGNSGDLKVGLSLQSLQLANEFIHQPLRLNVLIHAPHAAIEQIITKHELLENLVKNHWINIYVMGDDKSLTHFSLSGKKTNVRTHLKQVSLN